MSASLLRIFAGYSRFALQEERKHNRVLGSIFPNEVFKKVYLNGQLLEGLKSMVDATEGPERARYLQPPHDTDVIDMRRVTHIQQKGERTEYQINAIQYEANKGIQDRLVVDKLKSIQAEIISVFDGHGGDMLSDYCSHHVVEVIDDFLAKNKNEEQYVNDADKLLSDSLIFAYQKMDNDFYQNVYKNLVLPANKKTKSVGTCALTIVLYKQKIYAANCGDSEAIIVLKAGNDEISFMEISQRFSANNPAERERLVEQFPEDHDILIEQPRGCFYVKGRLQPTRALGDYHMKYQHLFRGTGKFNGPYIKSVPEVKIIEIGKEFERIVIGSDGVWDFLSKKAVAEASLGRNPHERILETALRKVGEVHSRSVQEIRGIAREDKRSFHDDISIAVVKLTKWQDA